MKNFLILLAALAAMLTFAASCSDDKEPETDIFICWDNEPDWEQVTIAGTVAYDSTLNYNIIIVDTIATPKQVVNFFHRGNIAEDIILEPLKDKSYCDVEESFDNFEIGSKVTFKIAYMVTVTYLLHYAHFYVTIKDVENAFTPRCKVFDEDLISSRSDFDNEEGLS